MLVECLGNREPYDLGECMLCYIRYLQAALNCSDVYQPNEEDRGERELRIRNLKALTELKEIELRNERGQLIALQKATIIVPRVRPPLLGR